MLDLETTSALTPAQRKRAIAKAGPVLRAIAQDERSQWRNRELAVERLVDALREALKVERPRRADDPHRRFARAAPRGRNGARARRSAFGGHRVKSV